MHLLPQVHLSELQQAIIKKWWGKNKNKGIMNINKF